MCVESTNTRRLPLCGLAVWMKVTTADDMHVAKEYRMLGTVMQHVLVAYSSPSPLAHKFKGTVQIATKSPFPSSLAGIDGFDT